MASLNRCEFIGYLGADPEMRYTANGTASANVRVACAEKWKDKNTGEPQERTEWVRVTFWGRQAEIAGQYLKKGAHVYVSGRMETRKWTDKDGIERYSTGINGTEMKMLDRREGGGGHQYGSAQNDAAPGARAPDPTTRNPPPHRDMPPPSDGPPLDFDDDIPF